MLLLKQKKTQKSQSYESHPDFLTNLNQQAKRRIDPLIGREDTTERLFQLGRRRKNNPVLVGESGVGKTAIAEVLAKAIQEENALVFADYGVMALDVSSLVSGTVQR